MRIRSKFLSYLLPLFFVALLLLAGSSFFYTKQLVTTEVLNHLESVASIQKQRIAAINEQNIERIRLLASRSQMRSLFKQMQEQPSAATRAALEQSLNDMLISIASFQDIALLNPKGDVISSTDATLIDQNFRFDDAFKSGLKIFSGVHFAIDDEDKLFVRLSGPIYLGQELLGVIIIKAGAENLIKTVSDYTGLGRTGETTLAMLDEFGDAVFITPLRFAPDAAMELYITGDREEVPIIQALQEKNRLYTDATDYRNKPVFAATQYIDATHWGLVAKIDKEEALTPIHRFTVLLLAFITLIVFIVAMMSTFFARRLTQPISQLQTTVNRIEQGETLLQAEINSRDEIEDLAASFNQMTNRLNKSYVELQFKINELNQEISSHLQTELALEENILKHQAIMETMVDGLIIIDDRGIVQSMNPAAEAMFGYQADDVIGWNVSMLMPETFQHHHDQYLHDYLSSGEKKVIGIGREIEAKHKDGHTFPIELSVVEIVLNGKRIFSGVIRDISERQQNERLKQEFVAVVSHELRTPLTSLKGSLNLISSQFAGKLDPESSNLLEVASRNADRLSILINDLLDMEKLQTGRFELDLDILDSHRLVSQAIENNEGYADKFGVRLRLQDKSNDKLFIRADEHRIQQVLSNLLSNAIKYSPKGDAVTVTIDGFDDKVRISVRDNGSGIPEKFRHRIFQKFMQADSSDSRKQSGTGLGLAISKNIVELHHGQIDFVPDLERGSCFFFELPRVNEKG